MQRRSKRLLSTLLAAMLVFGQAASTPPAATSSSVASAASDGAVDLVFIIGSNAYTVNGVMTVMDVSPAVIEDRTMLPIRFVAEPLGATVSWEEATSKVTVQLMDTKLELWIGQSNALVNGKPTPIDPNNPNVKPITLNDRTMLPVRFVSENLGCGVGWDEATQQVTVAKDTGGTGGTPATPPATDETQPTPPATGGTQPTLPPPETGGTQPTLPPPETGDPDDGDEPALPPPPPPPPEASAPIPRDNLINLNVGAEIKSEIKSEESGLTKGPLLSGVKQGEGNVKDSSTTVNKGLSFLGCGYNIFGEYAVPDTSKGLKAPVLDYKKMVERREIRRTENANADSLFENIESSAYDYCKKSTTNVNVGGGYMGFSASVNTNFGSVSSSSNNKYLATLTQWTKLYEYSLADPIYFDYSEYLLPSVEKALNDTKISPATILDTYGTHVMTSVRIGGRLDYNCSSYSQTSESFSSFKMNAKASFNIGFASGSGTYDTETEERVRLFNSRTDRNVILYGGTAKAGQVMDPEQAAVALGAWRASLNADPTFTDFGGQPLKPIWELCSSPTRRAAIQAEFNTRAQAQKSLFPLPKYVTGFAFPDKNQGPVGYNSAGNVNINFSTLWNDSWTPYYLFYLLGENVNYAYTDLFVRLYPEGVIPPTEALASPQVPWRVTHNGNTGNFNRISPSLNADAFTKDKTVIFGTRDKTNPPIIRIEVLEFRGSAPDWDQLAITDPGWEYITLLNERKPYRFFSGDGYEVYIRFMRE